MNRLSKFGHGVVPDHVSFCGIFFFLNSELDGLCPRPSTCESHRLGIEVFCNTIKDVCLEAGRTCIPECKPAGHSKPGWNAEVKELREDSLFWHRLWVDISRPQTGVVATVMRNTRYNITRP